MIILLVILAIIAIAGFAVTTALRKGLDPKDECGYRRLCCYLCYRDADWQRQNHGSDRGRHREDLR